MADKLDYKKEYKDLYQPKAKPSIIEIPSMQFIMVDGLGDPNTEGGEYSDAMQLLYGISYTIKMSKMGDEKPSGYFEYVVPPLEGLWWLDNFTFTGSAIRNKGDFRWISMIRLPEFVTPEVFTWAQEKLAQKDPSAKVEKARLEVFDEGLCAQIMHIGPYDDEPETITKLSAFIHEQGYTEDISDQQAPYPLQRRHHEIYLGDPRKTAPEKRKTVIRHPIRKA